MELYKVSPTSVMQGAEELYLRTRKGKIEKFEDIFTLHPETEVSTDTYFNLFSSSKYSKYTTANKISITTIVSGDIDVELRSLTEFKDELVKNKKIISDEETEVSFTFEINNLDDSNPVCHYILYRAKGESKIHSFGSYVTDSTASSVDVGIVICTYRRESRAIETLGRINEVTSSQKYRMPRLTVYLVDNGKTIENRDIIYDFVKLIPNENTGGSGGYARGMLEARDEGKTHVLLMDDDVYIDPNVIHKTVNFISILNEDKSDSFILGGMLLPESPTVQYEAGAEWLPEYRSRKSMLNLSTRDSLLLNDKWEPTQYGGWWFQCMPVSATDELPLPLFIKMDDVLFGLRRMKNHIVMNGIGIWHDSFESKTNPAIDFYFLRRNGLILDSILNTRNGFRIGAYCLRILLSQIKKQENEDYFFTVMAIEDFLKGSKMFSTVEGKNILSISAKGNGNSLTYKLKEFYKSVIVSIRLVIRWNSVSNDYRNNIQHYTSENFWRGP